MKFSISPLELKIAATLITCFCLVRVAIGQPDYYGEPFNKSLGYYSNSGRILNSGGFAENEILYTTNNSLPQISLKSKSTFSVWWTDFSPTANPTITAVNRIDVKPTGPSSSGVLPIAQVPTTDKLNVYSEVAPNHFENISGYQKIKYPGVYPNINMVVYSGPSGPKFSFVCTVGSNPDNINLHFTGQDSLKLEASGNLRAFLNNKWVTYTQAIAYQYDANDDIINVNWQATYNIVNGQADVKLNFGTYDTTKPLVFQISQAMGLGGANTDGLLWSTTYSGDGIDEFYAVDHDPSGNIYVGGYSWVGLFPITTGVSVNPGSYTATLAAFNSNHQRIWATYYGGSQADEVKSLSYSTANSTLYATGYTSSSDFPLVQATGATNGTTGSNYILRMNPLTGTATWASKIGLGRGLSIACKPNGEKYIAGFAPNGVNPVLQTGSYQQPYGGGQNDGIVLKFNTNDQLVWSTYFGGVGDDEYMEDVCTDDFGNLYLFGETSSPTIPIANPGGNAYIQNVNAGGGTDFMIAKFNSSDALVYSTFYGGTGTETSPDHDCIQVGNGHVYIGGYTSSGNFPITAHTGSTNDDTYAGSGDAAIIVMNASTMAVEYSTFVGGNGFDGFYGVSLDTHGNAYYVGTTTSTNGFAPVYSPGLYYDDSYNGGGNFSGQPGDGWILRLDANTLVTSWLTYFGGQGPDALWGVDAFSDQHLAVVGYATGAGIDYPLYDPGNAWFQAIPGSVVAELLTPDGPISVSEITSLNFSIFPNPASETVSITAKGLHSGIKGISMFDVSGRICFQQQFSRGAIEFSVKNFQSGCYVVQVQLNDGTLSSAKLLIAHE